MYRPLRKETSSLAGKPNKAPAPDPNVGLAAAQNANTSAEALGVSRDTLELSRQAQAQAQQAQQWAQDFQNNNVAPAIAASTANDARNQDRLDQEYQSAQQLQQQYLTVAQQQQAVQAEAQGKQNAVTDQSLKQMQLQQARYEQNGIPAEDAYYKMAQDYSAPQYQEQQAGLALGDQRAAAAGQQQQTLRTMASLGISPGSPAALSLLSDASLSNTAAEAAGSNRARQAAQSLGMSLKSDAANFGRGGLSALLGAGQVASGSANSTAGIAGQSGGQYSGLGLSALGAGVGATTSSAAVGQNYLAGVNGSAGVAQTGFGQQNQGTASALGGYGTAIGGYGTAIKGYTSNLDAYTDLSKQRMALQAQNDAGFGKFLGGVGTAVATHYFPASDRRLKMNIEPLGEYPSGLKTYTYDFIDPHYNYMDGKHVGVMADEAKEYFPDAVMVGPDGYYRVDYAQLR
jgi:hypothetical protein